MKQKALCPTVARALQLPPAKVEWVHRLLMQAGLISGKGRPGHGATLVNVHDTARLILALLSFDQPVDATAALERSLGLVALVGDREQELVAALEVTLTELMDVGDLGEVEDFKLTVGRPWPIAAIEMGYRDGTRSLVEFHHRLARGPDASSRLAELEARWGYSAGSNRWATLGLEELTLIADTMVGRQREQRRSVAELFAAYAKLPPGSTPMVFARAMTGPPSPAEGGKRARRKRT